MGMGYIYGQSEARWVFFIVSSGAPMTYLSAQMSASTLFIGGKRPPWLQSGRTEFSASRKIMDITTLLMSPSDSQFPDVNIAGGDFCDLYRAVVVNSYNNKKVQMVFGRWQERYNTEIDQN